MSSKPSPSAVCDVIIEDQPHRGSWNMAVDEALLDRSSHQNRCTLRWYRWSEATLSLGYFQSGDFTATHPELEGLPVVRRLTGGGAILHHHELTYSLTLPRSHPAAGVPHELYRLVHQEIIETLSPLGYSVSFRGEAAPEMENCFLCFSRGDASDIIFTGHKVLGSAQRRRRGGILQHGSLLLKRSEHAPQFPGLCDLGPEIDDLPDLAKSLSICLLPLLGRGEFAESVDSAIKQAALELEGIRYQEPRHPGNDPHKRLPN